MNIKSYSKELFNYDNGMLLDENETLDCFKGGKGSYTPPPSIAPAPPVEEASVAIEDENKMTPNTSKAKLKVPLTTTETTGLNL